MEDKKIVNIEEETEVKESKFKELGTKIANGVKKHGKAIIMAGVGVIVLAGCVLGYKLMDKDSETIEVDANDVPNDEYSENEPEE